VRFREERHPRVVRKTTQLQDEDRRPTTQEVTHEHNEVGPQIARQSRFAEEARPTSHPRRRYANISRPTCGVGTRTPPRLRGRSPPTPSSRATAECLIASRRRCTKFSRPTSSQAKTRHASSPRARMYDGVPRPSAWFRASVGTQGLYAGGRRDK
jgi:hypothetical protein